MKKPGRPRPFNTRQALLNLKLNEAFFTLQADSTVAASAARIGIKISTQNFWAIPTSAPHSKRAVKALRICCVTRVG